MNATFGQILALHFRYAPEEIEAAGYSKMVAAAKDWADRHLEQTARWHLKDFLIEPEELRVLLYTHMEWKLAEGSPPPM